MAWEEIIAQVVDGAALPAIAVALALIYANLRRLEERVNEIAERVARMEGMMDAHSRTRAD